MILLKPFLSIMLASAVFSAAAAAPAPKPDLADLVQGQYEGDVISDARGSSRSGVDVTITKVAKNTVTIDADYDRIPPRTYKLTKVADTIQNVGGIEVFLFELKKSPYRLSLTIDDAAWSGEWVRALEPAPAE